jgi:hypothetical protein
MTSPKCIQKMGGENKACKPTKIVPDFVDFPIRGFRCFFEYDFACANGLHL